MSTRVERTKTGLKLILDASAQAAPRISQVYPIPDLPLATATMLTAVLEGVAQTGRTGIRVTSIGTLPGSLTAVFTILHTATQGATTTTETLPVVGSTVNLLLDQPIPAATHTFALQRTDAGQLRTWPVVTVLTPTDPTQGNISNLQGSIAALVSNGVLSVASKPQAITFYNAQSAQVAALRTQASNIGATIPAQNTLLTYLAGLGPYAWTDCAAGHDTTIPDPAVWTSQWGTMATEIATLQANIIARQQTGIGTAGGTATWGGIGGTLANQSDLQAALNGKASLSGAAFTGSATFASGIQVGGAYTPGALTITSGWGTTLYGKTGSFYDMVLLSAAGNTVMGVPTGTANAVFGGNITTSNNVYATAVSATVGSGDAFLASGSNGGNTFLRLDTSGSPRWRIGRDSTNESGSNAGSHYAIYRYSDTGAYLGNPVVINRTTGNVTLEGTLTALGLSVIASSNPTLDIYDGAGSLSSSESPRIRLRGNSGQWFWIDNPGGALRFSNGGSPGGSGVVTVDYTGVVTSLGGIVRADGNGAGFWNGGPLQIQGGSYHNQILSIGYDTIGDFGFIQALRAGVNTMPLQLNPNGGVVTAPAVNIGPVGGYNVNIGYGSNPYIQAVQQGVGYVSLSLNPSGGTVLVGSHIIASGLVQSANLFPYSQSLSLDDVKAPGLYQYDGSIGGTKPPDNSPNYRTIEIGSSTRFSQIAMPYDSDRLFFRRSNDSGWQPWREVYHSGNVNTLSSSLMAIQASVLAPQWVNSLPAIPNPQYPAAIWNSTTNRFDGGLVCITSTFAMYQNQGGSWVQVGSNSAIFGQVQVGQLAAASVFGATLAGNVVMSSTVIQSTVFQSGGGGTGWSGNALTGVAGNSTGKPLGFALYSTPQAVICNNGWTGTDHSGWTYPLVQAEFGSGLSIDGYDVSTLALARLVNSGSLLFKTPGTYYWTCPPGITILEVALQGAGGSGGSGGAAGGGGGFVRSMVAVVPGTVYAVVVGAGGASVTTANGYSGGESSFGVNGSNAFVHAYGGGLGAASSAGSGGGVQVWDNIIGTGFQAAYRIDIAGSTTGNGTFVQLFTNHIILGAMPGCMGGGMSASGAVNNAWPTSAAKYGGASASGAGGTLGNPGSTGAGGGGSSGLGTASGAGGNGYGSLRW